MDLRSLRLYLAVIEHGSITKASESAHVAQPALGLHIRKLEEELGLQLLERHSRGVRVTEAGGLLAKHAEVILRYADLAKEELTNYAKVPSGHVTIGLTPTAREAISVALVERVSRDLPGVQLTVKEALSESLVEYLLDRRVDAALIYNTREGGDQLTFEPLASESMYFVYPLADGRRTQATDHPGRRDAPPADPADPAASGADRGRPPGRQYRRHAEHRARSGFDARDPRFRQPGAWLLGDAARRRGQQGLQRDHRQPDGGRAEDQAHPAPWPIRAGGRSPRPSRPSSTP